MQEIILIEAQRYARMVQQHTARLPACDSLRGLAMLMGTWPHSPARLRGMPSLRSAEAAGQRSAQGRGEQLLQERLKALAELDSPQEFLEAKGRLLRDVRLLSGHLPRVVQSAPREIARLELALRRSIEAASEEEGASLLRPKE